MNISGEKGKYFPFELHISLTNMCNQKCIHCYKKAGEVDEKIDYNELLNFLKYMEGKVPFLTLSGGDALMYPYIENILNIFGNTYQICVMTSGFDIKDSSAWGNYNGIEKMTGSSEMYKANNIYDFAGNCLEFTQEVTDISYRISRGGKYDESGSALPASCRYGITPAYPLYTQGARPALYMIP